MKQPSQYSAMAVPAVIQVPSHSFHVQVLNVNVWSASLLHVFAPAHQHAIEHATTWSTRSIWASVTSASIGIATAIAWLFPFFSVVSVRNFFAAHLLAHLDDFMVL